MAKWQMDSEKVTAQQVGLASACRAVPSEPAKEDPARWIEDEVEELERWDGME